MEPRKRTRRKERLPQYLSEPQIRLFFQKIPVPDAEPRMAFKLMYVGLLRVSEVCHLYVRDLDFAQQGAMIRRSKTGDRFVQLDPEFASELQRHVEGKRPDYFVVGPATLGFDRHYLHRKIRECAANAGLTREALGFRLHCHTLRHSGAREYLRKGLLNVVQLKKMLGHKDLATTSIYLDTLGEDISEKLKKGGLSVD